MPESKKKASDTGSSKVTLRNATGGNLVAERDGDPIPSGATFTVSQKRAKQLLDDPHIEVEEVAEPDQNEGGEK
jgi:hypothetical protein